MSEPFLGEIRMTSWGFAAKGWALCNGQILPVSQNQALASLLGKIYGGDGVTTFGLPDLRGRVPIHFSPQNAQGAKAGEEAHTLTQDEMAMHQHNAFGSAVTADTPSPEGAFWASGSGLSPYAGTANASMWAGAIGLNGGGQPHENMQPYLTISFMIALVGIFPPRD